MRVLRILRDFWGYMFVWSVQVFRAAAFRIWGFVDVLIAMLLRYGRAASKRLYIRSPTFVHTFLSSPNKQPTTKAEQVPRSTE